MAYSKCLISSYRLSFDRHEYSFSRNEVDTGLLPPNKTLEDSSFDYNLAEPVLRIIKELIPQLEKSVDATLQLGALDIFHHYRMTGELLIQAHTENPTKRTLDHLIIFFFRSIERGHRSQTFLKAIEILEDENS